MEFFTFLRTLLTHLFSYKWTTFWNKEGYPLRWYEYDGDHISICQGTIRLSDALVFRKSVTCENVSEEDEIDEIGLMAKREGDYLKGRDLSGNFHWPKCKCIPPNFFKT